MIIIVLCNITIIWTWLDLWKPEGQDV